jgi:hypothetical protein
MSQGVRHGKLNTQTQRETLLPRFSGTVPADCCLGLGHHLRFRITGTVSKFMQSCARRMFDKHVAITMSQDLWLDETQNINKQFRL